MSSSVSLVCLRHGESSWNADNRFCGWVDVDLSARGLLEAHMALASLKETKLDHVFCSVLKRALDTAAIVAPDTPLSEDWRLVERHYGALTGLNKAHMLKLHGAEQVAIWRRSYDVRPPPITKDHPYFDAIESNRSLSMIEAKPRCEALKDLVDRTIPFFQQRVEPLIKEGKNILIVAHGTSLRCLVQYIEGLSELEVSKLNLPTGIPFVYQMDCHTLRSLDLSRRYLADQEVVDKAINKTAVINKEDNDQEENGDPKP